MVGLVGGLIVRIAKAATYCVRSYHVRRFARAGKGIRIGRGFAVHGPDRIQVEDGVVIASHVTLRAMVEYPWTSPPQRFASGIVLKRGCFINSFTEIAAAGHITIGEDVMIGQQCCIIDMNHGYEDVGRSVKSQAVRVRGEIRIGDGSWLGAHCVVVGGVTIGRHCVVGAHSLVNRDVPDFCVAAGAPARVLKRYDGDSRAWRTTWPEGTFR
jgi:acetyltransferase-like isoleucine patch superfamily enzyme